LSKVFQSGYGFDRYIRHPEAETLGWTDREEYFKEFSKKDSTGLADPRKLDYILPKETLDIVSEIGRLDSINSYCPPIDGHEEKDFLEFVKNYPKDRHFVNNFRTILALSKIKMRESHHKQTWMKTLDQFFAPSYDFEGNEIKNNMGRNYSIFRLIELNEFLYNAKTNTETLEEYLERDSQNVSKACKELNFKKHSSSSTDILYSLVRYADFENEVFYNLFLKLTTDKLLNFLRELEKFFKESSFEYESLDSYYYYYIFFMYLNKVFEINPLESEREFISRKLIESIVSKPDFADYMKDYNYNSTALISIPDTTKRVSRYLDLQTFKLLCENNGIGSLTARETIMFSVKILEYSKNKFRWNKVQSLFMYYSLKNKIISPKRFIEFFINLKDPSKVKSHGILSEDFFESISDDSVPIEWAISMTELGELNKN